MVGDSYTLPAYFGVLLAIVTGARAAPRVLLYFLPMAKGHSKARPPLFTLPPSLPPSHNHSHPAGRHP